MLRPIYILGIQVHPITKHTLHEQITELIQKDRKVLILNVNIHALNLAFEYPWLRNFLNRAEIVFCDGAGVLLAARLLGHRIPERITYAEWMWELAQVASSSGLRMYLLGSRPGVAEKAAVRLRERFPSLNVVGTHHGYFNRDGSSHENTELIQEINARSPHILVVGMGMPLQEAWLMQNWDHIHANVALTGGAVFDYVSGELPRAPRWMTDHGMEWLGRMLLEPRRLARRYLVGNPVFFLRLIRHHVLRRALPE